MKINAPQEMCEFTRWQIGWNNRTMPRQVFGPSGGYGGSLSYLPFGPGARIVTITAHHGDYVDYIEVTANVPGSGLITASAGGPGGASISTLTLNSDERIVALSGRCGAVVDSLTITTDKRGDVIKFGGTGGSNAYGYDIPEDRDLSGLVVRSGIYLDAIGLILDPRVGTTLPGTIRESGPSGGWRGPSFTDTPTSTDTVTQVWVRHDGSFVTAVGLTWHGGATPVTRFHGAVSGGILESFDLEPDEFVIGIAGRCGEVIDSLIIQTNKRFSKRYGGRGGNVEYQHICWPDDELVGFFGQAGTMVVNALGCIFRRRT